MRKIMVLAGAMALVATAVVAAPKPRTGTAAPKPKAGMTCPMTGGGMKGVPTSADGNSAKAGGTCCAGATTPSRPGAISAGPSRAKSSLVIEARARTTVVGANDIEVTLRSGSTPVRGATVTLASAMTSMDMGTEKVTAKEAAPVIYRATVHFSMGGPWRVVIAATRSGKSAHTTLNLNVR